MAHSAEKMINDRDTFVDLLLTAKDQVAMMILIDTDSGADEVALDEASCTIKQSPGGTTFSGAEQLPSSCFVLRLGRIIDAFVVSCDSGIEERRP